MQQLADQNQTDFTGSSNESFIKPQVQLTTDFTGGVCLIFLFLLAFVCFKGFQILNTQWTAGKAKTAICQQFAQQEKSVDAALIKFGDCLERPY